MNRLIKVSPSPHEYSKGSTRKLMYGVVIALMPALLISTWFFGWAALMVTFISVASCVLFEYLIQKFLLKKESSINDGSAIVTGLLFAFCLPVNLPVGLIMLGALVSIGVAKMTFGGLGNNPFNPAIVGRVFLFLSFPVQMTTWPVPKGFSTSYADAITGSTIDLIACEGCGVCEIVCPVNAIQMVDRQSGNLFDSDTRVGRMAHAKLLPGEGNSGKLVTEVRKLASKIATDNGVSTVLIDGSPGIGCPVIATVTGIKLGIIVTEPTLSGIHDMERVNELLGKFKIKATVIINKFDLNMENTEAIEKYCEANDIEILGKIKFDHIMTDSMVAATTLPEFAPDHEISLLLRRMWTRVAEILAA